VLHSHIPWVLHHGQWPHGLHWLCEAAAESYLPLLEIIERLEAGGTPVRAGIGITPILANQLATIEFRHALRAWFAERLAGLEHPPSGVPPSITTWWRDRLRGAWARFERDGGDILGPLSRLADSGAVELLGSSATHALLPLLARDESIRLHLAVGRLEHRRLLGRDPGGCWLPECGYRPRERWAPGFGAPRTGLRRGIDEHLADAGYRYCIVDAHMAGMGSPPGWWSGTQRAPFHPADAVLFSPDPENSPYMARRIKGKSGGGGVTALVRDPVGSRLVWDRGTGYPGDPAYLEFHRHSPWDGLRYWSIGRENVPLEHRDWYDPADARRRAKDHARHLLETLSHAAGPAPGACITLPFDTELFGHWWSEGPEFLGSVWSAIAAHPTLVPSTPGEYLRRYPPSEQIRLSAGTWGAGGDFRHWLNDRTAWLWGRVWSLEQKFWDSAGTALSSPSRHPLLAQAGRELLLAQASDWPFMLTNGEASDYAERRFSQHCTDAELLVGAMGDDDADLPGALRRAGELQRRDNIFPGILTAIRAAVSGSRAMKLS
ncbi:MAG: 1,4-alpha-glucan branching protein domain-containing protein, partial [Gemmatimonadales bacterium]